jgi:hypothetical protein
MDYVLATKLKDGTEQVSGIMTEENVISAIESFEIFPDESHTLPEKSFVSGEEYTIGLALDEKIEVESMTFRPVSPNRDDVYWIDSRIDALSDAKLMSAYQRAKMEFGGVVVDPESEEFKNEFNAQLMYVVAKDDLDKLLKDGEVEVIGVNDDGHAKHQLIGE